MASKAPEAVPDRFPCGLDEYALTRKLDPLWVAGLAAYVRLYKDPGDRQLEEWDALLDEFKARPVTC